MEEAVSDVLDLRMRESDGLSRMVVLSLIAHGVLLAAFVLMPADWRGAKSQGTVDADDDLARAARRGRTTEG